ncbi:MAG: TRAM domain-containing protein [Armatimonadetes bacterium]|nr:TRAM domain-containing protein [Armatimonadota bacterium]
MVVKLTWALFTLSFSVLGGILGVTLGNWYVRLDQIQSLNLESHIELMSVVLMTTLGVLCGSLLGSWISRRMMDFAAGLNRYSALDKGATVLGILLGLITVSLISPLFRELPQYISLSLWFLGCVILSYLGVALTMGMKDEITQIFLRLSFNTESDDSTSEGLLRKPKLLDTNVIIDGRMADMCKTGFIEGPLLVPSFVLQELQLIADSADGMRRARGRRGLDILNNMRKELKSLIRVYDDYDAEIENIDTVDAKLVRLARDLKSAIVTNDYNLNKVAELQGVEVLNINELANSLKPVVLPGEEMTVSIVKEGKEENQGVAYLEDGTMVVVEDGRKHIGTVVCVSITSVYQTAAGKMIFADARLPVRDSGDDLFDDNIGHYGGGRNRRKSR